MLKKKDFLIDIAMITAIVALVSYYFKPIFTLGLDNLRLVYYFRVCDGIALEHFSGLYTNFVIPPKMILGGYPTFYYYLAGIILFPYTLFSGIDYGFIAFVLRFISIISFAGILCLLYWTGARIFNSKIIGMLAVSIIFFVPQYTMTAFWLRPHMLGWFINLLTIYFCLLWLMKLKKRYFWIAVIITGIACSALYMNLFLIPLVLSSYIYYLAVKGNDEISRFPNVFTKISSVFAVSIIATGIAGMILTNFNRPILAKYGMEILEKIEKFNMYDLLDFYMLIFRIASLVLTIFGIAWLIITTKKTKVARLLNNLIFSLVSGSAIIIAIFILFNPAVIFYTEKFIKGFAFVNVVIQEGLGWGEHENISAIGWVIQLLKNSIFHWSGGILLFGYFFWEFTGIRKKWQTERIPLISRLALLYYILLYTLSYFLFVAYKKFYYMVPILPSLSLLMGCFIAGLARDIKKPLARVIILCLMAILLLINVGVKAKDAIAEKEELIEIRKSNVAFDMAEWLFKNYNDRKDITIGTDKSTFYIPPYFYNTISLEDEPSRLEECDLIIITQMNAGSRGWPGKISTLYREKAKFKYRGTEWYEGEDEPSLFLSSTPYVYVFEKK